MKADFTHFDPQVRRIGRSPVVWLDLLARFALLFQIVLALIAGGFLIGLGQSLSSLALTTLFPATFTLY